MNDFQTVRVFLTVGGFVDIRCAGFRTDSGQAHYVALGPVPEDKNVEPETWAKFQRAAVAGFVVVDTQPHMVKA